MKFKKAWMAVWAMGMVAATLVAVPGARAADAAAGSAPAGLKSLAVAAVRVTEGLDKSIRETNKRDSLARVRDAMDSQLIDRFHNTRKFKIVARSDLDKVLGEQNLGDSGNCNPADPKVAKAFLLSGAEYALVFTIDDFQDAVEQMRSESLGVTVTKRTVRFSAVGKLWHATTGELLESMSFPPTEWQDIEDRRGNVTADSARSDRLLIQAARGLADMMANRATDVMYPAKVLAKTGKQVTINRGDGTEIAVGQIWGAFATGKVLTDPDTGEVLGKEEMVIGKVRILSVLPKTSTGEVLEDNGIETGAILRRTDAPPPGSPAGASAGQ